MKVCFVLHSSGKGGAERANLELIDGLKNKEVKCFAILPSYGVLVKELEKRNVPLKIVPFKRWVAEEDSPLWKRVGRIILNLIMIAPVAIQAKKWKVDVIYTNTITISIGAFAARILTLPHVWHIHEFGYEDYRLCFDLGVNISLKAIKQLSSICIANSDAVAKKYRKFIPNQKLKVIYQSVNISEQYSSEYSKYRKQMEKCSKVKGVIVGSLQKGKRQEDAIKAVGELIHDGINVQLYIIGESKPEYKQYLDSLIAKDSLEEYITFLGYIDNPFPVMQQVDFVLMCSKCEAFGRVTVEGMKAEKPVIGVRSGGTSELIKDNFNGLFYTFGNHLQLAEKIKYLYNHPEEAKRMGKNGKQWATEKFNEERYAGEVIEVLRQVIG